MNKLLCITAAMAFAFSGAAFAKGSSHSRTSDSSTDAQQFSASDCGQLAVQSARASCMRWVDAHPASGNDANVGATSDSATGSIAGGSSDVKRRHKRKRSRLSDAQIDAAATMSGAQDMSGMNGSTGLGNGATR